VRLQPVLGVVKVRLVIRLSTVVILIRKNAPQQMECDAGYT